MSPMVRSIFAVVGGIIMAMVVVMLVQGVSLKLYPLPEGIDLNDKNAFVEYIRTLPIGAFLLVLASWFVGPAAGSLVAGTMARRSPFLHAAPIAVLFLAASIFNMSALPHPSWFWLPGILASPLGAACGAWFALPSRVQNSVP